MSWTFVLDVNLSKCGLAVSHGKLDWLPYRHQLKTNSGEIKASDPGVKWVVQCHCSAHYASSTPLSQNYTACPSILTRCQISSGQIDPTRFWQHLRSNNPCEKAKTKGSTKGRRNATNEWLLREPHDDWFGRSQIFKLPTIYFVQFYLRLSNDHTVASFAKPLGNEVKNIDV